MGQSEIHVNELLFYIQNKIHAAAKDVIIDSCVKFYSLDEVMESISLLKAKFNVHFSTRNKSDNLQSKLLNDLYDKIWSLDATGNQLPTFAAIDISRIPRERENTDSLASTEQLLSSIHNLKSSTELGDKATT